MRIWCVEKPKRSALLSLVALCPWRGIGWSMPCPFSFFAVIIRRRVPRNVCNAWKKSSLFLRRYYWCTFMSSATKCKWMCWEYLWNHVLLFCVLCHVGGQWSWPAALFRQPSSQGPVWCFLLMTLRIIGLEASQWNCNISLACNGSVCIDSKVHLWLSHYGL